MTILRLLLIIVAVVSLGCGGNRPPPLVRECEAACKHLSTLPDNIDKTKPCHLSQPTEEGLPCTSYCKTFSMTDRRHRIDPVCMERAASCEEADRCSK